MQHSKILRTFAANKKIKAMKKDFFGLSIEIRIPVLLFLIVTFLTGCSTQTNSSSVSYIDDNEIDTTYIELHRLDLDEVPLYPMLCYFCGDNLVVEESKGTTDLFKIYNNQKLVTKFGNIGQAAEDFTRPFLYDHTKSNDSCFYVEDINKLVQYHLGTDGNVTHKNTVFFPDSIIPVNQVAYYQDSVLVFRRTDAYQLSFYDMKTNQRTGYNFYEKPKEAEQVEDYLLNMNLFRFEFGSCGDYIVSAYNNFKIIDIISAKQQKLIKRLYFKGYDANPIIISDGVALYDLNFLFYFDSVIADEDGFYARSWDIPFIENDRGDKGVSKIYRIDYDGHIQKLYAIKQIIRSFTIKDNEIYAICLDPEEQEWMIYKGTLQ